MSDTNVKPTATVNFGPTEDTPEGTAHDTVIPPEVRAPVIEPPTRSASTQKGQK